MDEPSFSTMLVEARRASGKSLRAVAREVGVSPGYVSDMENGRRDPAEPVARRLAVALGQDERRFVLAASYLRVPKVWREEIERHRIALGAMLKPQPVAYTATNRIPLCGRCFVVGTWNGERFDFPHEPDCAVVAAQALLSA